MRKDGLELTGYFGVSATRERTNADRVGSSSVEVEEFSVLLSKGIGRKFRLNGGLSDAYGSVEFHCALGNEPDLPNSYNQDFRMLSIPVFAEYGLTKFLFVSAGAVVDFQLFEDDNFDIQSGIGYLVGIGGKVHVEKFTFLVFPK